MNIIKHIFTNMQGQNFFARTIILTGLLIPSLSFASFNEDLYYGLQQNSQVSELQEFLTDKGYYSGPITGNFYSLTLAGVKAFQGANGINQTGYFGPLSRSKANSLLSVITDEQGVAIEKEIVQPRTTDDVVSSLTDLLEQVRVLQEQLAKMQEQSKLYTTPNGAIIDSYGNVIKEAPALVVVPTIPDPPVATKMKVYAWSDDRTLDDNRNSQLYVIGGGCQSNNFRVIIFDQYGEAMINQEVTATFLSGSLTKTITKDSVVWIVQPGPVWKSVNYYGEIFRYRPISTSTAEFLTFQSGNLIATGTITTGQSLAKRFIETPNNFRFDSSTGTYLDLASGTQFDPETGTCPVKQVLY